MPLEIVQFNGAQQVCCDPNQQTIQNNGTITSSSNAGPYTGFGAKDMYLIVNVTGTVSGSSTPTLTFTLQELDPIDQTTVLQERTGKGITATGQSQVINIPNSLSGCFKVTWTVTGTTPSFGGVYVSLQSKGVDSAKNNPFGHVRSTSPTCIFEDVFSGGTVDTTIRWTTGFSGGGSVSQANGALTLSTGTTASNSAIIETKPTFHGGVMMAVFELKLEATYVSNNHRYWGWGSFGSGNSSNPVGDGFGFEITTGGVMRAVVFQNNAVLASATISRPPKDNGYHRYAIYWRSDVVYFCIDDDAVPVAALDYKLPAIKDLSIRISSYNSNPGPASGPTFVFSTVEVFDVFGGNVFISDPAYPFRMATVSGIGGIKTQLYTSDDIEVFRARSLVGAYRAATSLIGGSGSAQNLLSIHNPNGSGKNVYVRRIMITPAAIAVSNVKFAYRIGRTTGSLPSGGSTLTSQKHATADATAVAVVISAPTASADTGDLWTAAGPNYVTAASAFAPSPLIAFAEGNPEDDIVLAPNEGLLVRAEGNDTDMSHVVNIAWSEGTGAF